VFLPAWNEAEKALGHGERRNQKWRVVVDLGMGGEVVKDHMHPFCDLRVAGQQAQVGIKACGNRVVISSAEMAVAACLSVLVAANQQSELAMGLESNNAVKDLDTGVFHAARPADVGGLVEAGHEFHNERGFFGGRGLDKRC